jgi:regulatory protein YycI of two-component signal transduction system YycFG
MTWAGGGGFYGYVNRTGSNDRTMNKDTKLLGILAFLLINVLLYKLGHNERLRTDSINLMETYLSMKLPSRSEITHIGFYTKGARVRRKASFQSELRLNDMTDVSDYVNSLQALRFVLESKEEAKISKRKEEVKVLKRKKEAKILKIKKEVHDGISYGFTKEDKKYYLGIYNDGSIYESFNFINPSVL